MATASKKSGSTIAKPVAARAAAAKKAVAVKAPAKKAAVAGKAQSAPARAAQPAGNSAQAAKKNAPAKSTTVTKKTANTTPAKSAKPVAAKAPAKSAAPAKKAEAPVKKAAPAPAKKAAAAEAPAKKAAVPAKKTVAPVKAAAAPARKAAAPEPAAKKAAAPAAAPAKAAKPSAKAAAKAKPVVAVLPAKPAPKPSPSPNAFIGRDEKKPATVVAHRRAEARAKDDTDAGMTMISYKPDFTRSILDQQKELETGPVYRYSDEELKEFRELIGGRLESARKELGYLQGLLTHKGEAGTEDTDNRYMNMEDGSGAMERENLAQLASRQIQFINHLEKALIRIENKTYGICRVTGKLIDKARLRAVPHATLSVEAKKMMNK